MAESCTGGAISSRLTTIPGASRYFLGGFIAYSNEFKQNILKIDPEIITAHGAVSEKIVKAMALGALHATGSDFTIAISGIAGPSGGNKNKPIGTVWIAIGNKNHDFYIVKNQFNGNRGAIIAQSVETALQSLYQFALNQIT